MSKKASAFVCVFSIYFFYFLLNYFAPMGFGDDYLYSFVWQGNPMYVPLTEEAVRVSSWHDLFVSQWSHYNTWSGRTVNHTIAQLFLWMGKDIFNYFNAFISTLLIIEIYWFIDRGKITFNFNCKRIWWIFVALWAFTPGFAPTYIWLDGACNYLWTNTIILGFLLPYVHKYYQNSKDSKNSWIISIVYFFFGIIAGWTNENSICWLILVLILFIYDTRKNKKTEIWMYSGLFGMVIGYSLLMLAPGNTARLHAEHGSNWLNMQLLTTNVQMFFAITVFHFIPWYFVVKSFYRLKQIKLKDEIIKRITLAKVLCALALGMNGIMIFSPFFPPRSAFAGTIYLIIAAGILLSLQKEYDIALIQKNAIRFLSLVGCLYFVITAVFTIKLSYETNVQAKKLIESVKQLQINNDRNTVLSVKPFRKATKADDLMSGMHIPSFQLSEDENAWMNVAFARYYGIKGIKMVKEEAEKKTK